jgi:hypothetical protein
MSAVNAELAELLVAAGCGTAASMEASWSRFVMVYNVSRIPRGGSRNGPRRHGVGVAHRGFNLILLDESGDPSHYVKCRPAGDPRVQRETRVMAALHAHPALGDIVPDALYRTNERLAVHVCPYVEGENLESDVASYSARAWQQAASEILLAADLIAEHAPAACPADVEVPATPMNLLTATAADLQRVVQLGLSPEDADAISLALSVARPTAAHPQHGDMWPANIVKTRRGWQILDFEDYGLIQVPLFDAIHFARSAPMPRGGATWFDAMSGPDTEWTTATRSVLRAAAQRRGLERDVVTGALVYYLVSMTARLHDRDNPRPVWAGLLSEVQSLAALLRAGEAPVRRLVA